jgi:hypothetical protein
MLNLNFLVVYFTIYNIGFAATTPLSQILPTAQFIDLVIQDKSKFQSHKKVLIPNLPTSNERANLLKGLQLGDAASYLLDYQICKEEGQNCTLLTYDDLIIPDSLNEFLDPENSFKAIPKSFAPNVKSNLFSILENVVKKRTTVFRNRNCKRNSNLYMKYSYGIANLSTSNYGSGVHNYAMYKNIPRYQNDLYLSYKRLLNSVEGIDLLQNDEQVFSRLQNFAKYLGFIKYNLELKDLPTVRDVMNKYPTFYQYIWSKKECEEEYVNIRGELNSYPKQTQKIDFKNAGLFLVEKLNEGKAVGINSICLQNSQTAPYRCERYGSMIVIGYDSVTDSKGNIKLQLLIAGHGMDELKSLYYPTIDIRYRPFWIGLEALSLILYNQLKDDLLDNQVPTNAFIWFE